MTDSYPCEETSRSPDTSGKHEEMIPEIKDQPKISVIVSVYNAEKTLARSMKCFFGQTWQNLEILLMDDGSTDSTLELCDSYAEKDPRIRVFHLEHKGVPASRNAGLAVYTGEYLMFADADDLFDSHYVEYLYLALRHAGVQLACCPAHDVYGTAPQDYRCIKADKFRREDIQIIRTSNYRFTDQLSHRVVWGAIFSRECISNLKFEEKYIVSTDTLFIANVLHRLEITAFLPYELYCYVIYDDSVSHRKYDNIRYDDIHVWEEVAELFSDIPGLPADSSRRMLDSKRLNSLRHLAIQNSNDKKLKRELTRNIRFRYHMVFTAEHKPLKMARRFVLLTFPRTCMALIRKKHR